MIPAVTEREECLSIAWYGNDLCEVFLIFFSNVVIIWETYIYTLFCGLTASFQGEPNMKGKHNGDEKRWGLSRKEINGKVVQGVSILLMLFLLLLVH